MKDLFRPTLVRRVVLALAAAFVLAGVLLLFLDYRQAVSLDFQDQETRQFGMAIVAALEAVDTPVEARAAAGTVARILERRDREAHLPDIAVVQLWDRHGVRLFSSESAASVNLVGDARGISDALIHGKAFRVFRGETRHGSVVLARPVFSGSWVLELLAVELLPYLLIAFPLMLIPVWLVVSQGLRPLRSLSANIASRDPEDLGPVGVEPKYLELKPLVSALDRLLRQLRDKVERENAFVHEAAHELRTPLAVIGAQAHALARTESPEDRRVAQQRLDQSLERASHMMHQLLQMARMSGELPLDWVRTDVAQQVRQTLAELVPMALAKDLDLSLDAPDNLPWTVDVHSFQSILHNLVGNAIRYVPQGGRIVVELASTQDQLVLSVADDGPGIPQDQWGRVFERFHRGGGHDVPGSGLGLAIVRQAAQRMGGGVSLASGLDGKGCRFRVVIAARQPQA